MGEEGRTDPSLGATGHAAVILATPTQPCLHQGPGWGVRTGRFPSRGQDGGLETQGRAPILIYYPFLTPSRKSPSTSSVQQHFLPRWNVLDLCTVL